MCFFKSLYLHWVLGSCRVSKNDRNICLMLISCILKCVKESAWVKESVWAKCLQFYSSGCKDGFIQKVWCVFQIYITNNPNHYPELEIWISCLLLWAGNSNFKFRIVIWNIYFGDLTNTSQFLKRSYLYQCLWAQTYFRMTICRKLSTTDIPNFYQYTLRHWWDPGLLKCRTVHAINVWIFR